MAKRKQHFVPRFYLKAFQSNPKRIHLYNFRRSIPVKNASLRDQCYKRNFYGSDGKTEDSLALLERNLAPVLQSTVSKGVPPPYRSNEHDSLLYFVALQLLRTEKASYTMDRILDKSIKQVFSKDPRFQEPDLGSLQLGIDEQGTIQILLNCLQAVKDSISDLRVHLLWSPHKVFMTCDNPIFRYNKYCEGIRHMGVTGGLNRGLQIFAPVSPNFHLILFDDTAYRIRARDRFLRTSEATYEDIDNLNVLQLIAANQNVYFSCWRQHQDICRLLARIRQVRNREQAVVREYVKVGDPNVSLIHQFERPYDLALSLSFLDLRKGAQKVPLAERPHGIRTQKHNRERYSLKRLLRKIS